MSICRLCLNPNDVLHIFNDDGDQNDISQKIFDCVDIQISKDNVLPTAICTDCLGSVNTWCLFKQKCHQTQTLLMDSYKEAPKKRLGPNCGDILNVQIKAKPVSEDVKEESDQMIGFRNDPNLDIPTNRCLICKCKYSSFQNLQRHTNTKMHQILIKSKIKNEDIKSNRSLLKQALVKKIKKRRAQRFSVQKHICHTCQIVFPSSTSLKRHCLSIKHQKVLTSPKFIGQPKFEDQPKCLEQDNNEEELEEIPEEMAEDEEFEDKDSCEKGSTSSPQSYSCKICNFKLANKKIYMNHIRIYHRILSEN